MKAADAALTTALRSDYDLVAKPRLSVEWNHNAYTNVTADNIANESDYGFDDELFDIDSIVSNNRPTKGASKALVGQAIASNSKPNKQNVRFYLPGEDDSYKYWISPVKTDSSGVFPNYTAAWASSQGVTSDPAVDGATVVRPYILYDKSVKANKITIKTENSWATPSQYEVFYKSTTGGSWISTGITSGIDNATGRLDVYWTATGWSTSKPTGNLLTTDVAGVMFKVTAMGPGYDLNGNITQYQTSKNSGYVQTTGHSTFFSLIEIAAMLEADLSSKLTAVSDDFDVSDVSLVYPIGKMTGQTGSISLSNLYTPAEIGGTGTDTKVGLFDANNSESPYSSLIEPNAVFTLEYIYEVNGQEYPVQQFKMYGGPWEVSDISEVKVPLRDYSKFFDEQTPTECLWKNLTVSEIVWHLCDRLGFVDYDISIASNDAMPTIPYFWTDGTKTMMEILSDLSESTQTAMYFDNYGRLQIRSRDHIFDKAAAPVWTLRAQPSGTELTDIATFEGTGSSETNHVTVNYYTSGLSDWQSGHPQMERVWEPEGTVTLRGSHLQKGLVSDSNWIQVSEKDALTYPFSGIVQIEGEFISFEGKEYTYYDGGMTTKTVKDQDEQKKIDDNTGAFNRWKNKYTGRLKIKERGIWNTEVKDHPLSNFGYSVRKYVNGTQTTNANGLHEHFGRSTISLNSSFSDASGLLVATKGASTDTPFYYYGTRLRFPKGSSKDDRAGLVFNSNGTNESGYYVELQATPKNNFKKKKTLVVYSRTGGSDKQKSGKGAGVQVNFNEWMDIDVIFTPVSASNHVIDVSINGQHCLTETITTDINASGGRFGLFTRGSTHAEFEYLYAVHDFPETKPDQTSYWDMIEGSWMGKQWETMWQYDNIKKKKSKKHQRKRNARFFDDFGPWVHEVREYDLRFDPAPVVSSRPILINNAAILPQYSAGPFGGHMIVANIARRDVVVNGKDNMGIFANDDGPDSVFAVYGRVIVVGEAEQVIEKNDLQVKKRGKIETVIDSSLVQSKHAAENIGNWILDHWSTGADEYRATIMGNPLFEIGDVVAVDYPLLHMTPATHKYFITSISTSFENGVNTSIGLRRVT